MAGRAPQKRTAQKAAAGRTTQRGNYADYAPAVFRKSPAARMFNTVADLRFPAMPPRAPTVDDAGDPGLPSAAVCELGEALTGAGYWALGLPPPSSRDGEGHPYLVAANRAWRFGAPRAMRTTWFAGVVASLKARLGGKKEPKA